ncbi:DUF4957 domain-containing protein [Aestuariibaculum marinum]|uniref:DUF4957 domain-containing protein n=1 Tax=Aestuariibaculum marinum TaxID=2683592 RepID=A0A8J6PTM4_9FLAO|nr:DUF5123 domain-containing protein [Aestuariibaculum marinum]MBD0823745.1 DUF4957 domain-containing protein [Aestuariibaculum marinum]
MKNKSNIFNIRTLLFLSLIVTMFNACDKDDEGSYDKTRLFRPVLNQPLFAEGNTIVVNMGKLKGAVGYTIEVSRDTFQTIEYTIPSDTNYVEINANNVGEELFWNTIYQVRATAHEADPQYDSKISDFGGVRTERFPSILNVPETYDVTDVAARVTWTPLGDAVTGIKVFASDDLRLTDPLFPETTVTNEQFLAGEAFVEGLEPETQYQIAIYSGSTLRGWVNYTTLVAEPDYSTMANLIDLRGNEDRNAVADALDSAPEGATILVSRGLEYDAPGKRISSSVTIRAAYGFGEQRAILWFPSNFDLEDGATVDHIRFVGLECRGTDWGGKYVINISKTATLNEFSFDNCYITNFRGIYRQKDNPSVVNNYIINNSVVDSIGGYGVAACDKDTATLNNIKLSNSTFNHIIYFIISRNNSESITIEDCTIANAPEKGRQLFRYRGGDGKNNVTNGVTIVNTIFGHGWNQTEGDEDYAYRGKEGMYNTNFTVNNTFTVNDFSFSSNEIGEITVGNAGYTQDALWVDPMNSNFNFLASGFLGQYSAGDPRWRTKL